MFELLYEIFVVGLDRSVSLLIFSLYISIYSIIIDVRGGADTRCMNRRFTLCFAFMQLFSWIVLEQILLRTRLGYTQKLVRFSLIILRVLHGWCFLYRKVALPLSPAHIFYHLLMLYVLWKIVWWLISLAQDGYSVCYFIVFYAYLVARHLSQRLVGILVVGQALSWGVEHSFSREQIALFLPLLLIGFVHIIGHRLCHIKLFTFLIHLLPLFYRFSKHVFFQVSQFNFNRMRIKSVFVYFVDKVSILLL